MLSRATLQTEVPWQWALCWLLLPNLVFILMWWIGGPPMAPVLLTCSLGSLLIAQFPFVAAKRLALAAMMLGSLYYYVCVMFNIGFTQIELLIPLVLEVRPLRSPEYLVGGALFLACLAAALWMVPRVPRFRSPMPFAIAVLPIMGLVLADISATMSTRGSYRNAPPPGAEYTSAVEQAGLTVPDGGGRHLVIVLVEALGVPTGREEQQIFADSWNRPGWRARYDVTSGSVPFYGSTTSGELRELCARFDTYERAAEFGEACLPMRYRAAGYETHAIHGFTENLFNRDEWYPRIGFDSAVFRDGLSQQGVHNCIGVFEGACDREIPALIAARLKAAERPQLVYFLTLNTHLPIVSDAGLDTENCALGGAAWSAEFPQVCRLFMLHGHLADELSRMAMDPALPPTDFLIVGDHLPPFFDRRERSRFDNAHVPWVMLRSRAGAAPAMQVAGAPGSAPQG